MKVPNEYHRNTIILVAMYKYYYQVTKVLSSDTITIYHGCTKAYTQAMYLYQYDNHSLPW